MRRPGSSGRAGGFALVIVLWVLAGLTVVAVSVAATVRSSSESVKLLRERLQAERAFLSTASRIKVIGATATSLPMSYFSERGQLFLDGRITRVSETEIAVLQDARGLLSVNQPEVPAWVAYIRACGASGDEAERLQAALVDYVDRDSLRSLHGAEKADYEAQDLPAPRNASLMSREELWRVLGWPEFRVRWDQAGCSEGVAVSEDGGFNPNTAPASILMVRGYDDMQARALMDARAAGLPALDGTLLNIGQGDSPLLRHGGRVGDRVRVRHQVALVEWALQYDLQFTLGEPGGPWRMHEVRVVAPLRSLPALSSEFPPLDFVASPQDRARLHAPSTSPIGF